MGSGIGLSSMQHGRVAESLELRRQSSLLWDRPTSVAAPVTDTIAVPLDRDEDELSVGIPVTYVPARNTVMLSLALGYAEVVGAEHLSSWRQCGRLHRLSRLSAGVHRCVRAGGEPRDEGGCRETMLAFAFTRR